MTESRHSEEEDPERLADALEHDADQLEKKSEDLGDEIETNRRDWEAKRADPAVPGAQPRHEDSDRDAPGDDVNPADAGR